MGGPMHWTGKLNQKHIDLNREFLLSEKVRGFLLSYLKGQDLFYLPIGQSVFCYIVLLHV